MKLLGLVLVLISSFSFAATNGYDLKMEFSMNGKHVSSPRVIVKAGEMATITQKTDTEETFIEIIATEGEIQNNKGILMTAVIGTVSSDGTKTIISKPQILAKENKTALIQIGNKDSEISLSIIAKRKTL